MDDYDYDYDENESYYLDYNDYSKAFLFNASNNGTSGGGCPNVYAAALNGDFNMLQVIVGCFCVLLSLLGIAGNIFTLVVLSKNQMKTVFTQLVTVLFSFDTLVLFGSILMVSNEWLLILPFGQHFFYFYHPLNHMVNLGTVYMTAVLGIERFNVFCRSKAPPAQRDANGRSKYLLKHILPVIILSLLLSFSKFFDSHLTYGLFDYVGYRAYFAVGLFVINGLIPLAILAFTGFKILGAVKRRTNHIAMGAVNKDEEGKMLNQESSTTAEAQEDLLHQEKKHYPIFKGIFIVFLMVYGPCVVLFFINLVLFASNNFCASSAYIYFITSINIILEVLVIMNSASRSLICLAFSPEFRRASKC